MVDLQNGSNDHYYGPLVNNPVDKLLTYQSDKDIARIAREVELSYEATEPASTQAERPVSNTDYNIPARTSELGQSAIDGTIDSHETRLVSTADGSVIERTVGYGDLLIIGNNLEAARLDAVAANKAPSDAVRGEKVVGIANMRQSINPEEAAQNDFGLAA